MKLAFGCDPNAQELKTVLIREAQNLGHEVVDYPSDDPIYANVAIAVASDVAVGRADPGAYCACVADVYQAQRATLSNNANIIAMGSLVLGAETAKLCLREYLANTFDPGSRSGPKVDRIREYESTAHG